VLGSFPVLFGLSFQAGVWAILLGVGVGALILAPMGLFGALNGTNNAVSSGAHFGVHGRIVGSFLSLLTAVAFFSLSVWSSGDALVGGAKRLAGLPETDLTLGLAYGLFAVLVLVVCIFGFRFMLWVNKIAVWASSLLFLLGIFAFAGPFDAGYAGSVNLGQAGFWAAFVGAAILAMSNPVSFGAFLGDWSRYIPRETPKSRIMLAVIAAQGATLIPFLFGLCTATLVATRRRTTSPPTTMSVACWPWRRLVLPAGVPDCGDRRHVHRHHGAVRHRPGHVQRVPAPAQPRRRHAADRRAGDRLHLHRPLHLQPGAERVDLRRADHHLHQPVDGDHDPRPDHPPRLLPRR
jgi:hypothetical protein